jgi:hypothetical protein
MAGALDQDIYSGEDPAIYLRVNVTDTLPEVSPIAMLYAQPPNYENIPGFSDVPLVVDVLSSTPEPMTLDVPSVLTYEDPVPPAAQTYLPLVTTVPPSVESAQIPDRTTGDLVMNGESFLGIDFPSAREILGAGLNFLAQELPATRDTAELRAQLPRADMSLYVDACPKQYHPRKQPVKPRKSIAQSCVRNRHMNSLNPNALRRATRRLNGFMNHVKSAEKAIRRALGSALPHRRTVSGGRARGCVQCGRSARACVC